MSRPQKDQCIDEHIIANVKSRGTHLRNIAMSSEAKKKRSHACRPALDSRMLHHRCRNVLRLPRAEVGVLYRATLDVERSLGVGHSIRPLLGDGCTRHPLLRWSRLGGEGVRAQCAWSDDCLVFMVGRRSKAMACVGGNGGNWSRGANNGGKVNVFGGKYPCLADRAGPRFLLTPFDALDSLPPDWVWPGCAE
jgi:hypothetical protein